MVLVFACVKIYSQKSLDCFWKLQSSWLSDTFSIEFNNFLSIVGRSKTKHFCFGKNFLICSLGKLDFWAWGSLPVERKRAIIDETVFRIGDGRLVSRDLSITVGLVLVNLLLFNHANQFNANLTKE